MLFRSVKLMQLPVNKNNAPVVFIFKLIENVFIEYKNALHCVTAFQCMKQCTVICNTKVASEPENTHFVFLTHLLSVIVNECVGLYQIKKGCLFSNRSERKGLSFSKMKILSSSNSKP